MVKKAPGENPAALARFFLEGYLRKGRLPRPPRDLAPLFHQRGGVFVSLKKDGKLRGCVGTIEGTRPSRAAEIAAAAVSAATRDPRFSPLTAAELESVAITVDLLGPLERVTSLEELDPRHRGLVVEKGAHRGLLLPGLEDIDTPEKQLAVALAKAGLGEGEDVTLYCFNVQRYRED